MKRTWPIFSTFLIIVTAVLMGGATASVPVSAQRGGETASAAGSCPVMVAEALELLGDNCSGVERNGACYGYFEVDSTFVEDVPPDYFSEPSDLASLTELASLRTAAASQDDGRWGIAVMEVQANVPNTLPGQSVIFLLMGDAQIENAVDPSQAVLPADPVTVRTSAEAVARLAPASDAVAVATLPAGTQIATDARSVDSAWLRVVAEGQVAWVPLVAVGSFDGLEDLPLMDETTRTPMQAFYFTTGLSTPQCNEAPNALTVRSRRDMQVNLTVNGVDVTIGSTITFRSLAEDELVITVNEGHLETSDGRRVERGQSVTAITDESGDVAVWGEVQPASSLDKQIGAIAFLGLNEVTPENERLGHLLDYLGVEALPTFGGESSTPDGLIHVVAEGETLFGIARQYDTSIAQVIADNGLLDVRVNVGDELLISAPGSGYIDYENLTLTEPGGSSTTTTVGDCAAFAARTPLDALNRGINAFYWTPLEGAESYRVRVQNLDENVVVAFETAGPQTGLAGDLADSVAGGGINFAWDVQALAGGEVLCTSPRVTLPRSLEGRTVNPGVTVAPGTLIQRPAPGAINPVLNCVVDHFDGTFTARFGYVSDNVSDYSIPVGAANAFTGTANRGQPVSFAPGTHDDVLRVTFNDGESPTWTLTGPDGSQASARASTSARRCFDQPAALAVTPIAECVIDHYDGTFTARFDYNNANPGRVRVLAGSDNRLSTRGASVPTMLSAGRHDAFSVSFSAGSRPAWTLRGPDGVSRTATASDATTRCADQPPPLPVTPTTACVIDHYDGTFTARFSYTNSNPGRVLTTSTVTPEVLTAPPALLQPGTVESVVEARFSRSSGQATWGLRGPDGITRTAAATTDAPRCADQPAPLPVTPVTACVIDHYDNTFTARFSYTNSNPGRVLVTGANNSVTPEVITAPPTMLQPGTVEAVVEARFSHSSSQATWSLRGPDGVTRTATATADSPRCADQPPPMPVIPSVACVIDNYDGTYVARFNVNNQNTGRVFIGHGGNNALSPNAPANYPQMFRAGVTNRVTQVTFSDTATWTLRGPDGVSRTATASGDTSRCADQPAPNRAVIPQVECVIENYNLRGDTVNYTARFGYFNDHTIAVSVARGGDNNLSTGDGLQPAEFAPHRQSSVFSVDFDDSVTWTLRGLDGEVRRATANAETNRCADQPPRPVPGNLSPVLECVIENFDPLTGLTTGYTAYFGYNNGPQTSIEIPAGQSQPYSNRFSPGGNVGQPSIFQSGRARSVFSVNFGQGNLVWNLNGRTATASANSPRCADQQARPTPGSLAPIAECVIVNYNDLGDVTGYTARFGYNGAPANGFGIAAGQQQPYNNFVNPGGNVGQPGFFNAGPNSSAFEVDFNNSVTWSLNGGTATVNTDSPRCADQPPRPVPPITPTVQGVVDNCNGSYTATFGYTNPSATYTVTIPAGAGNSLSGASGNPPTSFAPGTTPAAFNATFTGQSATWTVNGAAATASAANTTNTCPTPTPEPVLEASWTCSVEPGAESGTLVIEWRGAALGSQVTLVFDADGTAYEIPVDAPAGRYTKTVTVAGNGFVLTSADQFAGLQPAELACFDGSAPAGGSGDGADDDGETGDGSESTEEPGP